MRANFRWRHQGPKRSIPASAVIWALAAGIIAVGLACGALTADYLYGDWTCVFKRCVVVKGEPDAR